MLFTSLHFVTTETSTKSSSAADRRPRVCAIEAATSTAPLQSVAHRHREREKLSSKRSQIFFPFPHKALAEEDRFPPPTSSSLDTSADIHRWWSHITRHARLERLSQWTRRRCPHGAPRALSVTSRALLQALPPKASASLCTRSARRSSSRPSTCGTSLLGVSRLL